MRLTQPLSVDMRRALNKILSECLHGGPGSVCDALLSNMAECEFFENSRRKSLTFPARGHDHFSVRAQDYQQGPFREKPVAFEGERQLSHVQFRGKGERREKDKGFLLKNGCLVLRSYRKGNSTFLETCFCRSLPVLSTTAFRSPQLLQKWPQLCQIAFAHDLKRNGTCKTNDVATSEKLNRHSDFALSPRIEIYKRTLRTIFAKRTVLPK